MLKNIKPVLICLLCVCVLASLSSLLFLGGISSGDLRGHWHINSYAIHGTDPYKLFGEDVVFTQMPWSLILGNLFYAGFLPVSLAVIWMLVLHIALAIVLMLVVKKRWAIQGSAWIIILGTVLGNAAFYYSMQLGNFAAPIAMITIIAILYTDEKPVLAGVLMGLALMKPQISMIFCLVWLMKRKWKPLFAAAALVVLGVALSAIVTNTSPVTLFAEFLSNPLQASTGYLGLFTFLQYLGVGQTTVVLLSMLLGAAYVLCLTSLVGKTNNIFAMYMPAAFASCFWNFKNGTDYAILVIAAFLVISLLLQVSEHRLPLLFCLLYAELGSLALNFCKHVFPHIPKNVFNNINGLVYFCLGLYLSVLCSKLLKRNLID
ncbi:MAG: DUF2029 domain-containing protein [Clostridiales Family XIII bacterium]|jgi:hypothetical protein|nr:DUF2029 domain-containing protein [Clostridiales Family XIII bacterium]